jgi:phospholipid/cholesterol/gamma-HCH transport system substrate-binding protein
MSAPTNHWKLGLFVVTGFVMTLTAVATLGARSVRTEVGLYVSYFDESVQGLDVGSPIKFRGVTIGTVGRIGIAPDHRHVEVTSELIVSELGRLRINVGEGPAKRDARKKLAMEPDLRVQLASSGLTGVKFLQLDFFDVTDNPAPVLPFPVPENYIPAAPSTMKSLEDSVMHMMSRLPEITDQMSGILAKVDHIAGELDGKKIPDQLATMLASTNQMLSEAQHKIDQIDTGKLSRQAEQSLEGLNEAVGRMNKLLAHVDGEKGLLSSVMRASDAFGDTVRSADGLGAELEDALRAVQEAARSIHKLADAVEKDPDMLLKGRARAPEKNR